MPGSVSLKSLDGLASEVPSLFVAITAPRFESMSTDTVLIGVQATVRSHGRAVK
jgi:hypothetical protein